MSGLVLSRRVGETIIVYMGDTKVFIKLLSFKGSQVRILLEAPQEVHIDRQEVYERKERGDPIPAVKTRAAS